MKNFLVELRFDSGCVLGLVFGFVCVLSFVCDCLCVLGAVLSYLFFF